MRKIYGQSFLKIMYFIDNRLNNFETDMINVNIFIKIFNFCDLKVATISKSKFHLTYCKLKNKNENAVVKEFPIKQGLKPILVLAITISEELL